MFLGVTASVSNWDADGTCCSIILEDNPLVDFVELPETCQVPIVKVVVVNLSTRDRCSIILEDNPLVDFVELPDTCQGLYYCNILSGVIRGALEMVSMKTLVTWIRDMLRGDDRMSCR
ncbi:hypothetical protein CRYUN_Cryun09bG0146600 [Craigia yunnanensis]